MVKVKNILSSLFVHYSLLIALCAMTLASCNGIPDIEEMFERAPDKNVTVTEINASDKYCTVTLKLDVLASLPSNVRLDDSTRISVKAEDNYRYIMPVLKPDQPTVKKIKYIVPEAFSNAGMGCLVIVDLCQPSSILEKEHAYVKNLHRMFARSNLFVTFMLPHGKMTDVLPASDYVIDNYINVNSHVIDNANDEEDYQPASMHHAYLYRSVERVLAGDKTDTGTAFDYVKRKIVLVLSDGLVYDEDNMPVDPDHFELQEKLIFQSRNFDENLRVYYNCFTRNSDEPQFDNRIMQMLCKASGGRCLNSFNANAIQSYLAKDYNIRLTDYEVTLHYEEGNILLGNNRYIGLNFYTKGSGQVVASCNKDYQLGSIFDPIIIGDVSDLRIYFAGAAMVLFAFSLTYIILQFILPYINYRNFRKKYVHKYTGPNMSVEGLLVADTCYFCKAPFTVGDDIVARCMHTMHLGCWEENGQHCPEYGKHCPDGSHYYNYDNAFDSRNATYHMKWVILAFIATTVAWFGSLIVFEGPIYSLLRDTINHLISDAVKNDPNGGDTHYVSSSLFILQTTTMKIACTMTAVFSFAASYHREWYKRLEGVVLRSICAMVVSFLIFYLSFCILVSSDICDDIIFVDLVSWTLMTYVIIYFSTFRSRIRLNIRKMLIWGLGCGAYGAIMWTVIGMEETVFQLLITHLALIVYAVMVGVTIAEPLPINDHAFLHVNGEIKEMDIALYKWFKQSDNAIVTIGRSVDCSLQLTWDTKSKLAPVQAKICQRQGAMLLTAVDGLVTMQNKSIPEGQWVHLYHGDTFNIGTTSFTYIET